MSLSFLLKSFGDEDPKPKRAPTPAGEISLAGVLQRQRLRLGRAKKPRPQSLTFSPSSITYNLCHRAKIAQMAGLTTLYSEVPTPKLQLRFDMGHAVHDVFQNYFWSCNMLEGYFRCIKCEKDFWARSPEKCPFRKTHERRHLKFREIPLVEQDYLISGRADGIVWLEVGKDKEEKHLMDIKSIQNRLPTHPPTSLCFEDLDQAGPKEDHVIQLMIYMWISGIHKGHLLYVSLQTLQQKSFYIEYDRDRIAPILSEIQDITIAAEKLKNGELKELPAPCAKKDCPCETICV